jgi:putative two-component system response regulator
MAYAPIEQLDRLLSSNPSASSAEAKVLLTRLTAEVTRRAQQGAATSVEFLGSASEVVGRIRGPANAPLRMTCLWECGQFFHTCGHSDQALRTARQLQDVAARSEDRVWIRRGFTLLGVAEGELGDLGGAILHYEKGLVLAREESAVAHVASLINLGTALNYCSLHREAIPCFQGAYELIWAEPSVPRTFLGKALGNMAQGFLFLEDFRHGLDVIRLAIAEAIEPSDGRTALSRAVSEWTFVQLALEMGQLDEARAHAAECRRYGQWGDNPRSLLLADICQGLCEVFGGDIERGLQILESTHARAANCSQREDTLRALVRAHSEAGHDALAMDYLRALHAELKERGERGMLALLSQTGSQISRSPLGGAGPDLRPLEMREAKLRARIAEREAAASQMEMLERFAVTADLKEDASGEHGYRVGKLSSLIAEAMGLNESACNALEIAARLHDIGKVGIPDRILTTSEKLKDAERNLMSSHAVIGAELLARSPLPQLRLAEEIARNHHEWWDGSGYPAKLKGKRIPLHARIVAVADVFDALTHGRPYAPAWEIEKALEEIKSRRGTQFDPDIADRFVDLIPVIASMHPDLDGYLGKAGRNSPFAQARQRIRAMLSDGNRAVLDCSPPAGAVQ